LVPELKAIQVKFDSLGERLERIESRLIERIEKVEEKLDRHDGKFEAILTDLASLVKNNEVILSRLDYGERLSGLEIRFERLEHLVKKAS